MNGPQTDLDHAAFERVWRRVMPQDRADCPFTVDPPENTVPAGGTALHTAPAAEPVTAAEPGTVSDPTAPPVGAMTALALQTMPAMPPRSAPPQAPAFLRQGMPGQTAAPCLGESALGELPTLEVLLIQVREGRQVYRSLLRSARAHPGQSGLLSDLMAAKEHQLRRLRTAHILISGKDADLPAPAPRRWPSLPLAIRDRYHAEQAFALQCLTAAGTAADPCLIDLYRSLASQSQALAGSLREALEAL